MSTPKTECPWKSPDQSISSKLEKDAVLRAEVLVIGSGFTGLTAALQLARAGKKVVVVDSGDIAGGESAYSSAQLTQFLDTRYHKLILDFGGDNARRAATASRAAMDYVEKLIEMEKIRCELERVPAFLYCDNDRDVEEINREFEACKKVGLSVKFADKLHPSFKAKAAISLDDQLQINPRAYLAGVAKALHDLGCKLYENTRVTEVQDGTPCIVKTQNGNVITASDVVVAAHAPLNLVFLQTKLYAYRTYMLAAKLRSAVPPVGQYFDTHNPYHYVRQAVLPGGPLWMIGGEDHKTGTVDNTEECFSKLSEWAYQHFDIDSVPYRWSGQILQPADGLPYIGKNSASDHVYVATGYSGNGTTFGTIAGVIVSDLITGTPSVYADLFKATRINPIAAATNFVAENFDALYRFIGDWVAKSDFETIREMPINSGGILNLGGHKAAVFRDAKGYHIFSAVCPHLSCIVHWNNSEQSFDCPCHGSRFDCHGKVVNGPAVTGLKPLQLDGSEKPKAKITPQGHAAADVA